MIADGELPEQHPHGHVLGERCVRRADAAVAEQRCLPPNPRSTCPAGNFTDLHRVRRLSLAGR
jgi:hypothetical protein